MKRCYVFDIDGTLADITHRLPLIKREPKDWDAFFDACHLDTPIVPMVMLARDLASRVPVIFASGRAERCREKTKDWLFPFKLFGALYMRKDGDHRPDYQVKCEMLGHMRADGWEPIMVFEDRSQVVQMWRENGIPCAQVADGNF